MTNTQTPPAPLLKRSMGLRDLVFYGTGTILGAGIFVVVGEVVAEARTLSPIAYLLAGTVALTTALSFSELGARIPTAGGPIDYVEQAFGNRNLGSFTGWALTIANIVSAATITTGFVSYLSSFADIQNWLATILLVGTLGGIAIYGIKQSALFMTLTTAIGMITLLFVMWVTRESLFAAPEKIVLDVTSANASAMAGLFAGAFLAIYSFIGFGDMAQTAEEVQDVKHNLPKAIVISIAIVFFFYLSISACLVGHDNIDEIANSSAPLVAVVEREGYDGLPIAIASLFVIVNGGLSQMIAASRLLLDLGRDSRGAPKAFGNVNAVTRTPVAATLAIILSIALLAFMVPLNGLASATSLTILLVFVAVNAALWKLKKSDQPADVPNIWPIVPKLGVAFCTLAIVGQVWLWLSELA